MIKILIVDDHAILRMGLISLFSGLRGFEIVGDAANGREGIQKAQKHNPDVVIMDMMMPDMDGIDATRALADAMPAVKILILTTFGTSDGIARALEAGALGAIMKSADFKELANAVRIVASGKRYISEEIARTLREDPPLPTLTPRQTQILEAIARGLSNPDISKALNISTPSVAEHVTSIFQKLGASNRTEAVAIALRKHLLKI